MEQYELLVLMNYNDNKECLVDTLDNVFKMNDSVCVVINNGTNQNLDDIKNDRVHIVQRTVPFDRFDTMIPLHLELYDYILDNNIQSDVVLMMATNQAFINKGFYQWAKVRKGAYFNREVDQGCIRDLMFVSVFTKYYREIGPENFLYQTNHDGCFFSYDDFVEMMKYLESYRNTKIIHHNEEFMYVAYLIAKYGKEKLSSFDEYNFWSPNWWCGGPNSTLTIDQVESSINNGMFFVKRVEREYNDPVRTYIREKVK